MFTEKPAAEVAEVMVEEPVQVEEEKEGKSFQTFKFIFVSVLCGGIILKGLALHAKMAMPDSQRYHETFI